MPDAKLIESVEDGSVIIAYENLQGKIEYTKYKPESTKTIDKSENSMITDILETEDIFTYIQYDMKVI